MELCFRGEEFKTIKGIFFQESHGAKLFFDAENIYEDYLVAFHERFHYLQNIFTPYGHMKWAFFRSITSEIINSWAELTTQNQIKKKIPVYKYVEDINQDSIKILANIHLQIMIMEFSKITEGNALSEDIWEIVKINPQKVSPKIRVKGNEYLLNGIDVIEGFAKYEEAILGYVLEGKDINETINPDILEPRYYSALYYFVETLGVERMTEFPIACELAMAFYRLPSIKEEESVYEYLPAWRFIKIVEVLKENVEIQPNIFSKDSYWEYTNRVLEKCNFETWEKVWKSAEEYARDSELSMANEMLEAIKYKKSHPWALSYPMCDAWEFLEGEFNRFQPMFVSTNNAVYYNIENINSNEIIFENEFQALALQICGVMSKFCQFPDMLQCGDSYWGLKNCPYFKKGSCDGHINHEIDIPQTKLKENGEVIEGCMMEMILNILGTSIKEIEIGDMRIKYDLRAINDAIRTLRE